MGKKGGICRLFCGQKSFYHNRAIFRALIGRELEYWLGNDVMVEQLPFLFLLGAISRETSTKMDVKISQIDAIAANKSTTIFHGPYCYRP